MDHDPLCPESGVCACVLIEYMRAEFARQIESLTCWNDTLTGMTVINFDEAVAAARGEAW